MKGIGTKITKRRETQGITRYRLAIKSGISFSYLAALEEGKHSPSLEMIGKVASALGVTVSELLDESEGDR